MVRTLLILTVVAVLGATATASAEPIFAVDVIAKHDVVWDYRTGDPGDACSDWTKGSGTQSLQIHSLRREQMRLEHAFGSVLLTSKRSPTFEGQITRRGRWQVGVGSVQPPCSPCGPNSEYGPCGPDPAPPAPLRFSCGTRDARSPMVVVGYQEVKGIPSLDKGMQIRAWVQPNTSFPRCPPNLPKGMQSPSLRTEWPGWEKLPKSDTARIARLQVGDSVVAEVKRQRAYVEQDGQVFRGDSCVHAPDLKHGYSECAVTDYSVTFTRLS